MSSPQPPSPELRTRFLAAAARTPATPPSTWRRRLAGSVTAALLLSVATAALLRARSDWAELPAGALAQTFIVLLGVSTLAAVVALGRGRAMVGAGTERLTAIGAGGLALLVLLVVSVDPTGATTRFFSGVDEWTHAARCDSIVVVLGLVLLGIGLVPLRGLTLGRAGLTGACVGLAAATLAHAVVRFHCGVGGPAHAFLGHLVPALPLMAIGAWASATGIPERLGGARPRSSEEKS